MRKLGTMGALAGAVTVVGVLVAGERSAAACGGCFTPQPPPNITESESVITDEKMILSISMSQTTLYDQINYSGAPSSFAWVLPIKGSVTVGLSADILFQTINSLTATTITSPNANCPAPPNCGSGGGGCGSSGSSSASFSAEPAAAGDEGGGSVTVTSQSQVGPYEQVQLHSTDGSALTNWLTSHGYQIPASTDPIINSYVKQGFDFLALKLVPGEGVQSMQPVRVTSQGAAPSLPLHMVAIGTGPTTGITIWVIADGRWAPSNFPTFTIADSELAWDWATSSSNYETLRLSKEAAYNGTGWQVESSLELSQYTITQTLAQNIEYDANGATGGYAPATSGGAPASDAGLASDASADAGEAIDASADAGEAIDASAEEDAGTGPEFDAGYGLELSAAAETDLAVLFNGIAAPNVRITRMRSDIAQSALSVDMSLEATTDQSELTNQHVPQQEIGEPLCPVYDSNCNVTKSVPRSQTQASPGGGCSTTRSGRASDSTLGFFLAFFGISAVRARQKRQTRKSATREA